MTDLYWPDGLPPRTSPHDRERTRKFEATHGATTRKIRKQMDLMGVDDWKLHTGSGGAYTKANGLPKRDANPDDPGVVLEWSKDGKQRAAGADEYVTLLSNLRELANWVEETRLAGQRSVKTGQGQFAAAALPSGDDDAVVTAMTRQEAAELLGLASPEQPEKVVRAAFEEKVKEAHGDTARAGDGLTVDEVQRARDMLVDGGDA